MLKNKWNQINIILIFALMPFMSGSAKANSKIVLVRQEASITPEYQEILLKFQKDLSLSLGYVPEIRDVSENIRDRSVIALGKRISDIDVEYSALGTDGFVITSKGDQKLLISGATDFGLEFACTYFLEQFLGVQWLFPSELWTNRPLHENFRLPNIHLIEKPDFLTRRLAPLNPEVRNALGEWGRRLGLRKDVEYGHNLYRIFANSNKYAPVVKGKQVLPKSKNDQAWQPNFNDKEAVGYAKDYIINYFKKNPSIKSLSLSINDSKIFDDRQISGKRNHFGFIDYSDSYYSWVKNTVDAVNKVDPKRRYGVLAYNNVASAPNFPLPNNVIPFITFERLRWIEPKFKAMDIDALEKWRSVSTEIGWYDYIYGNSYIIPRPYFSLISEYLEFAHSKNIKHYTAELYPTTLEGPKAWIVSKILWDTNCDVDELLTKWCESAFGQDAGREMKKFYFLWEKFWTRDIKTSEWYRFRGSVFLPFNNPDYIQSIPVKYMEESDMIISRAMSLTNKNSVERKRLEELSECWELSKYIYVYVAKKGLKKLPRNRVSRENVLSKIRHIEKTPMNERFMSVIQKYYLSK